VAESVLSEKKERHAFSALRQTLKGKLSPEEQDLYGRFIALGRKPSDALDLVYQARKATKQ